MATTILYLEDHEPTRRYLSGSLSKFGYRVLYYSDPVSASEKLEEGGFDIVISDLHFKGVNKTIVEIFLKDCVTKSLPVILLTGSDWYEKPADLQGITFKSKPTSTEELFDSIEEILGQKKKKKPVSDEMIRHIANPERHVMTPNEKWGLDVLSGMVPLSENERYSDHLERQDLQAQLDTAFKSGNWPKRDLDLLMDKFVKLKRNLSEGLKQGLHIRERRQCLA